MLRSEANAGGTTDQMGFAQPSWLRILLAVISIATPEQSVDKVMIKFDTADLIIAH